MTSAYLCTRILPLTALLAASLAAGSARAEDPVPTTSVEGSVTTSEPAVSATDNNAKQTPWIKRYRPVRNSWELGIYGGVFVPSKNHEFYAPNPNAPNLGHQALGKAGADIGLRVGYYPLSFLGLELEGGVMPMKVADGARATLYTFRPVLLFQLPYRITPFIRADFGLLGINSPRLGKDIDPTFGIGGGVKFYINRLLLLRVDVVDNIATAVGIGNDRSNNLEVLLGLSLRLGKSKERPKQGPKDTDGDGLFDPDDQCVFDPETKNGYKDEDGCPESDRDGDGFWDEVDKCPDVPGVTPDGCPIPDTDGDGFLDPEDKCVTEPETKNGFEDNDGCPDEIPKALQKFTGVIKGIYFDFNKDTIKAQSRPTLNATIKVLSQFPSIRIEISGHTDSKGNRDYNYDLSKRRTESVKRYLVEHGIDESRMETRGVGPDEPIDDNKSAKGRAKNRRIEFKILKQ